MDFLIGTVMLVTAIAMIGAAKYAVARTETSSWVRDFAGTEIVSLAITILAASGIAYLGSGIASDDTAVGFVELGAALGIVVLSIIGVVWVFRRATAVTRPSPPPAAAATS